MKFCTRIINKKRRGGEIAPRRFGLSFENEDDRAVHTKKYLPTVEIKDYNVMIDGKNYFDQSVKISVKT